MEAAPDLEPEDIGPSLLPVLEYMDKRGLARLQIVAKERPASSTAGVTRSADDFECFAEPLERGLHGVYAIGDDEGKGQLEGPAVLPRSVLGPLLRRLDELHVHQLRIETLSNSSDVSDALNRAPAPAAPSTTALLESPELIDIDETETHRPMDMGIAGVFITVRGDL